jgi:hypothetical protein
MEGIVPDIDRGRPAMAEGIECGGEECERGA